MCGDSFPKELGFYSKMSANLSVNSCIRTGLNIGSAELILMFQMILLGLFGAHSDVEARLPEDPGVYHMTDWITRLLIKQQKQIAYFFFNYYYYNIT